MYRLFGQLSLFFPHSADDLSWHLSITPLTFPMNMTADIQSKPSSQNQYQQMVNEIPGLNSHLVFLPPRQTINT